MWPGFIFLAIGTAFERDNDPLKLQKMRAISWQANQILAP
jgi:hypothetical protein